MRGLSYFGGVPRRILFDNAKTVVVERDGYGEGQHRRHSAEEYGFSLWVCRPRRARTNAYAERFVRPIKENA